MLEIRVLDSVQVIDVLPGGLKAGLQIIEVIVKTVQEWVNTGMKDPLTITLTPQQATGPPTLGINVTDAVTIKDGLG